MAASPDLPGHRGRTCPTRTGRTGTVTSHTAFVINDPLSFVMGGLSPCYPALATAKLVPARWSLFHPEENVNCEKSQQPIK